MSLSAAKPRAPDLRGVALDGRYELHSLIGEGTFGRVYRGRDRRLARAVAVKVIKPWWGEDPDWVERFEREAQLTARVSDPRIVQIFDVGHAEEGLYYVAELVHGESLSARLRRGRLTGGEPRRVAEQLSRALASAHAERIVHGDVKPANVLLSAAGAVKVTDFGMARLLGAASRELSATVAGTPAYMAPEQARGRATTPASDVYSIGVVLYEMLAGRPPFAGGSPVEIALCHLQDPPAPLPPGTPERLEAVVQRALAKDPYQRYRDGGELAWALARAVAPTRRHAPAAAERPRRGRPAANPEATAKSTANPEATATHEATANPEATATPETTPTLVAPRWSRRRTINPSARRRTLAVFAAVVVLLLAMLAGAILTTAPSSVRVPQLRGLTRAALTAKLTPEHLRAALHSAYSVTPRGRVIAQRPAAGSRIAQGASVQVTLSAGPAPVLVPGIVGFSSTDAERALRQLGLTPSLEQVPAPPGTTPGTVTAQAPASGRELLPGSSVTVAVAESPRWRDLMTFTGSAGQTSPMFRIRGGQWRVVYKMSYAGTCTFLIFCSGPTAHVANLDRGTTVSSFDLNDGSDQTHTVNAGPGLYQVRVTPGDDSAAWSIRIQDYF